MISNSIRKWDKQGKYLPEVEYKPNKLLKNNKRKFSITTAAISAVVTTPVLAVIIDYLFNSN